jgi:Family of unknown function (DUF5709)
MGGFRGSDETDAQEASSLLEGEDVLEDDGYGEVLDRGYSPRDTAVVGDDYDDDLGQRLAREVPDNDEDDDEGDEVGDLAGGEGELRDDEVGDDRAGRLSEGDDGYGDDEDELLAEDEGIDGAAASAEEAAVHVVRDPDDA